MSDIKNHVIELYNTSGGKTLPITEESVNDAISYLDYSDIHNSESLFVLLASLNLLNAAIKKDSLKSTLYYNYIKSNVSKVADVVLANIDKFEDVTVYYDTSKKYIFFNIYEVIFSFHQINETKKILTVAAKNTPIIWQGIRLQRIAQPLFEYAKLIDIKKNGSAPKVKTNPIIHKKMSLIPCPICGKDIYESAKFCPNCGFDNCEEDEIANGISIGDNVQLEVNGDSKCGLVYEKSKSFIGLKMQDEAIFRVKYSAISSILVIPREKVDMSISSAQIADMLVRITEIEGIGMDSMINTNASVKDIAFGRVNAVTDGGKSVICIAPLGFKRTSTNRGDRLLCSIKSNSEVCYNSIIEMTYDELCTRFITSLRKSDSNQRMVQFVNSILNYFRITIKKKESKAILRQIRKRIKELISFENDEDVLESSNNNSDADNQDAKNSQNAEVFKTESEQTLLGQSPKIVGSVDLNTLPGKKAKMPRMKLELIETAKSNKILSDDLPLMPESECRQVEKELDSMIREGKREECLLKSYEVITTQRPTPKYLRSYLDRIVNTEIALDNNEKAIEALAVLIAFSENQKNSKTNNLSHLYISLARLSIRLGDTNQADLALDWAEYINPRNTHIVSNLRKQLHPESIKSSIEIDKQDSQSFDPDVVVSRMLIQDVEQYAKTQTSLDNGDEASPLGLFNTAVIASSDKTKSFEFRAQMFLDAAASYFNSNLASKTEFKLSVAHYARMKGNSLLSKIAESVQLFPESRSHLIAECDSARSYYLEALGLYNDLDQKRYLQELLLKYLKIESLVSQIEGGKTPDVEWQKGTLKAKMKECLNDENIESQKVLYRTCVSIGSTVERAWNTLSNDVDGTQPFYNKLGEISFRSKAYDIINTMEKSNIQTTLAPGAFLRKVFEYRQMRNRQLKDRLDDCLSWDFDQFDISSFEEKWKLIDEYKDLMTTTDNRSLNSINEVITILKPYAGRKENERYRNLVSSQQILIRSQRMVMETTTYYGRIFFSHLNEKWLMEISHQIEERDARALPKLNISPEPCYININENGSGVIDFVVTNDGDSTAQSFVVNATINGKEYSVSHDHELSAGDSCGERFVSKDFCNIESADVVFRLIAKYQGRDLPVIETEAMYEVESGDILTDEIQIPWQISDTPEEHIFKGREKELNTLVDHYLSKDRKMTYILYGLTRTGKSSILDYLRKRINGQSLKEDPNKKILAFKWYLNEFPYRNSTSSQFWTWALETNIYEVLSDELANEIDNSYGPDGLPPSEQLSQLDFNKIVQVLNKKDYIPLITIDEFSFVRLMLKEGLIDGTFISTLRNLALKGKACFVYSGTYDIKDIPEEKEYIAGQMNNTLPMPINQIDEQFANELIDACQYIEFDEKARAYIRALSGCVPYWIQWICLDCGKYAMAHKKRHLGLNDVDYVVKVLTGEIFPSNNDTWEAIDEANFHNNQIDPNNIAEHQLISSIAYINRESTHIERGISMDELKRLWDKYSVNEEKRLNMTRALASLKEKKILHSFTDEGREVYRLTVDLFRRWWYMNHRDLKLMFSL